MTEQNQKQLGKTLWAIADQLRGAMDADDFRDYMLSFLFLRYLSDNYQAAAQRELGSDYPKAEADDDREPLAVAEHQRVELQPDAADVPPRFQHLQPPLEGLLDQGGPPIMKHVKDDVKELAVLCATHATK